MQINKSEIIEQLAAKVGITVTASEDYLNHFLKYIYGAVREGHKVNLSGFGWFMAVDRKERLGVDPRHPEIRMANPAGKRVKFKVGEAFKEAVK
jgi:DNA-binding protein HU-beta